MEEYVKYYTGGHDPSSQLIKDIQDKLQIKEDIVRHRFSDKSLLEYRDSNEQRHFIDSLIPSILSAVGFKETEYLVQATNNSPNILCSHIRRYIPLTDRTVPPPFVTEVSAELICTILSIYDIQIPAPYRQYYGCKTIAEFDKVTAENTQQGYLVGLDYFYSFATVAQRQQIQRAYVALYMSLWPTVKYNPPDLKIRIINSSTGYVISYNDANYDVRYGHLIPVAYGLNMSGAVFQSYKTHHLGGLLVDTTQLSLLEVLKTPDIDISDPLFERHWFIIDSYLTFTVGRKVRFAQLFDTQPFVFSRDALMKILRETKFLKSSGMVWLISQPQSVRMFPTTPGANLLLLSAAVQNAATGGNPVLTYADYIKAEVGDYTDDKQYPTTLPDTDWSIIQRPSPPDNNLPSVEMLIGILMIAASVTFANFR